MYVSPSITTYTREDLRDLMGPAETQYNGIPPPPPGCSAADVVAAPDTILQTKTDISVSFNFAACVDFATAEITLINSTNQRLITDSFTRADDAGDPTDAIWQGVFDFGFVLDPGDYMFEVILTDSRGTVSAPQFTSFTVL